MFQAFFFHLLALFLSSIIEVLFIIISEPKPSGSISEKTCFKLLSSTGWLSFLSSSNLRGILLAVGEVSRDGSPPISRYPSYGAPPPPVISGGYQTPAPPSAAEHTKKCRPAPVQCCNVPPPNAAVREVKEETGIGRNFLEVLAFRQPHKPFSLKSDLFFLCILHPLTFDVQKQDLEIEAAQTNHQGRRTFKAKQRLPFPARGSTCSNGLNEAAVKCYHEFKLEGNFEFLHLTS